MSEISKHFQRSRWSEVRAKIDAMIPGQTLHFRRDQYFNVRSSIERSNDAYSDERPKWEMQVVNDNIIVRHGECLKLVSKRGAYRMKNK